MHNSLVQIGASKNSKQFGQTMQVLQTNDATDPGIKRQALAKYYSLLSQGFCAAPS
jgi:hypothetical protein